MSKAQQLFPGIDPDPETGRRIEFTVRHEPVGWPRAGHRIVWPKGAARMPGHLLMKKTFVTTYTPEGEGKSFRASTQACAKSVFWDDPLTGPLKLYALFVFPRHKAKFWKTRFMPRYLKSTKPDGDNCLKILKDALTGIVYVDDAQVAIETAERWHASGYEDPHVEVVIETLPGE